MRLKARSWHRDDTLAELAEDVERLTRLAFPEVTEAMVHGGVGKRPICGCLAGRGHATAHQTKQACDAERRAETRTGAGILSTCQWTEAKVGVGNSSERRIPAPGPDNLSWSPSPCIPPHIPVQKMASVSSDTFQYYPMTT